MSNIIADIEYLIRTKSDLGGLQAYTASLKEQIASQGAAGGSTAALEQELRQLISRYSFVYANLKEVTAAQAAFKAELDATEESMINVQLTSQNAVRGAVGAGVVAGAEAAEVGGISQSALAAAAAQRAYEMQLAEEEALKRAFRDREDAADRLAVREQALAEQMAAGALAARQAREATDAYALSQLTLFKNTEAAATAQAEDRAITQAVAEAKSAAAAATLEEAAAHGANTVAMRESMVVSRELMMGNLSRIPGSLSILGAQFGLAGGAVAGFTAALFVGVDVVKHYLEAARAARQELFEFQKQTEQVTTAIDRAMVKSRDNLNDFWTSLLEVATKTSTVSDALEGLNRAAENAQKIKDVQLQTREDVALGLAKQIKDPLQQAQEEYQIKQQFTKQANAEADAADRQRYLNQQNAVRDAGKQVEDQAKIASDAGEKMDQASTALAKAKGSETLANDAMAVFQKIGLTPEQLAMISSGKFSFGDLATGQGHAAINVPGEPGLGIPGTQIPATPDYRAPLISFKMPGTEEEFKSALQQYLGAGGGQAEPRAAAAQSAFDAAKKDFDDASSKAKSLAEEFDKLNTALGTLADQLNQESALRNQRAVADQVKNLETLQEAYVTAAKSIETAEANLRGKGFAVPREMEARDATMLSAIQSLNTTIERLATSGPQGSTAFSFFKGGRAVGPTDVAPPLDVSGVIEAIKHMQEQNQQKLDQLQKQIQSK